MTITARYPGTCRHCRQAIVPGTAIEWAEGRGATHVTCPAARVSRARGYTCPRCGDHRDTTVSGHCDDCEA